jgi:quercetin dioxygenase-like cupin family protein
MEIVPESERPSTEAVEGVDLTLLAGGTEANIQQFSIDPGAVVPEHSHSNEQVGYLLDGRLTFTVDGEPLLVEAGDSYRIPGGEPHSAENNGDTAAVGLDIFSPPRDNPDWNE